MEEREKALKDALFKNEEETERWLKYKKENETAIENLEKFLKHLTLDVMVPVGKRAYFPGQLIHTNEVLVGHYQGYFSKCSSFKAKEICEFRIKSAEEHLEALKKEEELWQNKLEKPYIDGAVSSGNEVDIVEEYDEEKEKLWWERHRYYQKEARVRENMEMRKLRSQLVEQCGDEEEKAKHKENDDDVMQRLEELELMEELEKDLEYLENEGVSIEMIKKLMEGEIETPPPRTRIAHDRVEKLEESLQKQIEDGKNQNDKQNDDENVKEKKKEENDNQHQHPNETLQGIVKKSELDNVLNKTLATNNNCTPNPNINLQLFEDDNRHDDDLDDDDNLPEEVIIIRNEAKFLPLADQIGFYEYQIQIMREKMRSFPKNKYTEKMRALEVIEKLDYLLDQVEIQLGDQELANFDNEDADKTIEEIIAAEIQVSNLNNSKENDVPATEIIETIERIDKIETVAEAVVVESSETIKNKDENDKNLNSKSLDNFKDDAKSQVSMELTDITNKELVNEMEKPSTSKACSEKEKNQIMKTITKEADKEDVVVPVSLEDSRVSDFPKVDERLNKKRISFALEDQTLEFCNTETVSEMLQNSGNCDVPKRDIITLDEPKLTNDERKETKSFETSIFDRKQQILQRVEKNLNYVSENQSALNFDMVSQIINETDGNWKTLYIYYKHSEQGSKDYKDDQENDPNIPRSPSDIYENYLKIVETIKRQEVSNTLPSVIYLNSYPGEEDVKAPVLQEKDRQAAYESPKTKFSIPGALNADDETIQILFKIPDVKLKSILRNKEAVANEPHMNEEAFKEATKPKEPKKKKKKSKEPVQEEQYMSAYNKVMNEVVEKVPTAEPPTQPDPLPRELYVDAHAPKRRVSRFRLMRIENT